MATLSSTTESWAYDVTLAMCIAVVWWATELCSLMSQRRLRFTADFNRAWSVLSCFLVLAAIATMFLEQFLRDRHRASLPTSVATIVAASLSFVLVSGRMRFFDRGADIVQRILRCDKARFGRPGSKGLCKYVIEWRRFSPGSAIRSGWDEIPTPRRPNEQVLLDWSIDHRIGELDPANIAQSIRQGGDALNILLGILLYAWLPRKAQEALELPQRLRERGSLRAGYRGSRGMRIGCKPDDVPFEEWITERPLKSKVLQLIAVEYPHATPAFVNTLGDIVKQAESAETLARLFISRWDEEIEKVQVETKRRQESVHASDTMSPQISAQA